MGQCRPEYNAYKYPEINRSPSSQEIRTVKEYADELGVLYAPVS